MRLPAIIPAVLAQPAHALGDFWLARQNYSAVADRAEIFGRIEAEAADIADAAEPPARDNGRRRLARSPL